MSGERTMCDPSCSPETLRRCGVWPMVDSWPASSVNLGGLRHGPGRAEVLTYLHLSDEDVQDLEAMAEAGVEVTARDLPDAHRVSLETLSKSRWK